MNKKIKSYTAMFHNTYEMLAPKFSYETKKETKKLDFDSPNGKLMYATVEKIIYPVLIENQQLKEIINYLKKEQKKLQKYVCIYEEKLRNTKKEDYYYNSHLKTIHKYNAQRELIKEILPKIEKR